jgi:hypothetical protein
LVKLGRQAVRCNELELGEESVVAGDGDCIRIGGADFARVRANVRDAHAVRWLLSVDGGPGIQLVHTPFVVGGDEHDNLGIPGWPAAALLLHDVDASVVVELGEAARTLLSSQEAEHFDADGITRIVADDGAKTQSLQIGGRVFSFVRSVQTPCTRTELDAKQPVVLRLARYGRGGVLTIETGEKTDSVYLARLRFALICALIRPPPPAVSGDNVSFETLCAQIWPGQSLKTQYDFNVLLHRVRQDLLRAEIDVTALIERAHGSGLLSAPIARGATVVVEGDL